MKKNDQYLNSVYKNTIEQIGFNNGFDVHANDYLSLSYGLATQNINSISTPHKIIEKVEEFITIESLELNNLECWLVLLNTKYGKNITSKHANEISNLLKKSIESRVFPTGQKAKFGLLLSLSNSFGEELKELSKLCSSLAKKSFDEGDFEGGINLSFWIKSESFKANYTKFIEDNRLDDVPFSVLSKVVYYLASVGEKGFSWYEDRLNILLDDKIDSEVWFALIESKKIINSNLEEHINESILKQLKESDQKWVDRIEKIENEFVTINIPRQSSFTNLSNEDILFATLALSKSNRKEVYTIPVTEKDNYTRFISNNGWIISTKTLITVISFYCVVAISIFYLIERNWSELNDFSSEFYETKVNPKSLKDIISYLSNPVSVSLILGWWCYLVGRTLKQSSDINLRKLIEVNPIVLYLNKFFTAIIPK